MHMVEKLRIVPLLIDSITGSIFIYIFNLTDLEIDIEQSWSWKYKSYFDLEF